MKEKYAEDDDSDEICIDIDFVTRCAEAILSTKSPNLKGSHCKFSAQALVKKEILSFINVSISNNVLIVVYFTTTTRAI